MSYKYILLFGLLPAVFLQFVAAILYFIVFADSESSSIIFTVLKVGIFLWPLPFLLWSAFPGMPGERKHLTSILFGLGSGIIITILGLGIFFFFEDFFRQFAPAIREKTIALGFLDMYIAVAITISLLHSLLEEYFWRFFLFQGLLGRFSPVLAAGISSFGFSLHHFVVLSEYFSWWLTGILGFVVFCGGMIWCWLYYRTKSLLGSWISHIFVDAGIFAIGWVLLFS